MSVVVIRYNAGNVQSVLFALQRLGVSANLTDSPEQILAADRVIFPGVGEARSTMEHLRNTGLDEVIRRITRPLLGICLGLQLLCRESEENKTECLGVFDASVRKFPPVRKVPHIGWNTVHNPKGPLFQGLQDRSYFYFVHSYYAEPSTSEIGGAEYMVPFSAALQKDNVFAVQFHPEKSGEAGAQLLRNFLSV